jgi:hypothetical protein
VQCSNSESSFNDDCISIRFGRDYLGMKSRKSARYSIAAFAILLALSSEAGECPWKTSQDIRVRSVKDLIRPTEELSRTEARVDLDCLRLIFEFAYVKGPELLDGVRKVSDQLPESLSRAELIEKLLPVHQANLDRHMTYDIVKDLKSP